MLAPIDAAWIFLKAKPTEREERIANEPSHFGGVESFPKRWKNLQEHGDVRGAEPEGGWSGKQLEIGSEEEREEDNQEVFQTPKPAARPAKTPSDLALEELRERQLRG